MAKRVEQLAERWYALRDGRNCAEELLAELEKALAIGTAAQSRDNERVELHARDLVGPKSPIVKAGLAVLRALNPLPDNGRGPWYGYKALGRHYAATAIHEAESRELTWGGVRKLSLRIREVTQGMTDVLDKLKNEDLRLRAHLAYNSAMTAIAENLSAPQADVAEARESTFPIAADSKPEGGSAPAGEAEFALMRVFTNGIADDRIHKAREVLRDSTLNANEKLNKIDRLMPFPPTVSSLQLGEMLGVTNQAIQKTEWWRQNRKNAKAAEVAKRRDLHRERAKSYEPDDDR